MRSSEKLGYVTHNARPSEGLPRIRGTRQIAALEFIKGALVLLTGAGLIEMIHTGAQRAAEDVVRLFHLNPSSRYPRIFLDLADAADDRRLWLLAGGALTYATVRFVEAWGLWRERRWAAWFGLASGLIYVPIEIVEVIERLTAARVAMLAVNAAVVWVLARHLLAAYPARYP